MRHQTCKQCGVYPTKERTAFTPVNEDTTPAAEPQAAPAEEVKEETPAEADKSAEESTSEQEGVSSQEVEQKPKEEKK